MRLRISQGIAVVALCAYAAHAVAGLGSEGLDGFMQDWLYNGLIASSAAFCLARAALVAEERLPWALFGAGLASWFGGELYYSLFIPDTAAAPYPSLSDALYLAFYPLSYAGLTLLVCERVRDLPLSQWIDGIVAALAIAAVGCAVLLEPVMTSTGGDPAAVATDLAYPLADVILVGLTVGTFAMFGWRPGRSWMLIGASLVAIAVADGIFLLQAAAGNYEEGTLLDAGWPTATLLLGFAAWSDRSGARLVRIEGWRTLAIPSFFALGALALLLIGEFRDVNDLAVSLAAATVTAAIARMGLTFSENLKMVANSRRDALTDALTGLGNRRRLTEDLGNELAAARPEAPRALIVLDLDGFKRYNDTFGHPAGDALLARLGRNLSSAASDHGRAYRVGGDEFCALVTPPAEGLHGLMDAVLDALTAHGEGFSVTASQGAVLLPDEAATPERALQLADQRLYSQKSGRQRTAAAQQTRDALMQALAERAPDLREHVDGVAGLARGVGRRLALEADDLDALVRGAELHDVGKVAVPDQILCKPGPLDAVEWEFVRQHTVVGERILSAAPALVPVAKIVRSSHERWDGKGSPDRLSGEDIPLGARIVTVCDSYHAMTSDRPYGRAMTASAALAELQRCAGSQFDERIVKAFCEEVASTPVELGGSARTVVRPRPTMLPEGATT
nr:diguanylate cyclase [Thermoleophilaceae bacterium]